MDVTQIRDNLEALFASVDALQERRKLVFWYDPEGEFAEAFEELELSGDTRKIRLDDTPFRVKYRLLVEEPERSFLLYAPFAEPRAQENWLLDLQKQAELFSADRAAMIFRHYQLHQRSLLAYLKEHQAFFNSKKRSDALDEVGVAPQSDEMDLRLAMMCALAGLKVADATQLLRHLLMQGLSEAENALWLDLTKFFSPDELWQLVRYQLGFSASSPSLRELFIRLALTHLQHDLEVALPETLQSKLIRPDTKAYVFVDQWIRHSSDAPRWAELSQQLADDLGIATFVKGLAPQAYLKVETFQAFDQALIRSISKQLVEQHSELEVEPLRGTLSARKGLFWYPQYRPYYQALDAALSFFAALRQVTKARQTGLEALFKGYASEGFRVDQHYRHYVHASDQTRRDVLGNLTETIERAYTHSFLEPSGEAWSDALSALEGRWSLPGVHKQWRFYDYFVKPILERNDRDKVFVLISDALRYEIADELKDSLLTDLRGEASLTALQGVLPSITKLGMAALLPGDTVSVNDKGAVSVNGLVSTGTEQRSAILNAAGVSSVALQADTLLAMSREEGRQAVQPHRVIYIYQNHIDALGDKAASERQVFEACARAVQELNSLIRKIVNTLNGTAVLITSDHGFLYQRQPLASHDKVEPPQGEVLDSGRRHALGKLNRPEGTQTFSLPFLQPEGLEAQSPRGSLRYRLKGAGAQYVHGGASLQEVCVPLLSYKHVRASKGDEGPSHKVGVRVSAASRRITNTHFTVRLIQDEPVGNRARPRQVTVRFVDDAGQSVTNSYPLRLESTAPQATDREYIARFTVAAGHPGSNQACYLVVEDTDDQLEILRETWQLSLAFGDDFGEF